MKVKVRDAFNWDESFQEIPSDGRQWDHLPVEILEGLTDQSQARDADINVIVARFMKTGVLPEGGREVVWGDLTSIDAPDLRTALQMSIDAQHAFMSLDASIRDRFANDPVRLLEFVQNDKNYDEAVRLGLVPKKAPEASSSVSEPPSQPLQAGGQPAKAGTEPAAAKAAT